MWVIERNAGRIQLVGLVSAIFTKAEDINAGVNFAISAELLQARVAKMLADAGEPAQ